MSQEEEIVSVLDPNRIVGLESQKSYKEKVYSGFFDRFLSGSNVLDIGFAGHGGDGQPIVPQATGIDRDFPGYDGIRLPFPDESQNAIYSSHCYEHIDDFAGALREWYRVLKTGGYMVIVVPHQHLFERKTALPSLWNLEHKRFYTGASLLNEVESVFPPNSYRVRHMCDNDAGYNYAVPPLQGAGGCFEIELVLEKIKRPHWNLEDGSSRRYTAEEFEGRTPANGWWRETDFSLPPGYWIWGPYVPLQVGRHAVTMAFEAIGLPADQPLASAITIDVGRNYRDAGVGRLLDGASGSAALRSGSIGFEFDNDTEDALHEFRVRLGTPPFGGKLRFYGATLSYLGHSRPV